MNVRITLRIALAALVLTTSAGAEPASSDHPLEHPESRALQQLVADGAELIAESGATAACVAFKEKGSPWLGDETYLFVIDLEGNGICHPTRPDLEGRSLLEVRDPYGNPIASNILREIERDGEAWVHYLWPAPGGSTFRWKTTHARQVSETAADRELVVASGRYGMKVERFFIVDQVDDAVALIARDGEAAFPTLRDKSSGFRFLDSYVFVMAADGTELVNAGHPEIEGQNLLDFKDSNGKLVSREMLALLAEKESGWVEYLWPRPGDKTPSKKSSYVRRVEIDGRLMVVGAGYYFD